ncbi:MAG: hypothetical protein CMG75_02605 [Candidatus Marinimicrobia bacterium]|nr:hypothetical protein [Candidatus Neomarinimicrobiota bacterium]|tara:strand:+ start:60685 stop:62109 length:1425 start_codon:yes stop_codon:yes gene_type:complete
MPIAIAALILLFLIYYFVKVTGAEQNLDLQFSSIIQPGKASVEATLDVNAPAEIIWKHLMDMSSYRLWYPWVHRLKVTNDDADRWVHKHSLLKYKIEVGSIFNIQPFFGAPFNRCRFITIDPHKKLVLEMCFFPFNKEIVTFNLLHYKNCVELSYSSTSNSMLNFMTALMFSWNGKKVLQNFNAIIPDIDYRQKTSDEPTSTIQFTFDDNFINALIFKSYNEGVDILNVISEKIVRAKAKSGLVKAKRAGSPPHASSEHLDLVNQFLSGGSPPSSNIIPETSTTPDVPEEILINQYILKGLDGDMDTINGIEDRILRGKVKSAIVKAKRTGERPETPAETPDLGSEISSESSAIKDSISKEDDETIINSYVLKAMNGDEEAVASIKDRILRAKVKSAIVKAKKSGRIPEIQPGTKKIKSTDVSAGDSSEQPPKDIINQAVQAALNGNMDLINGIDDRVNRAKAKSALAKAKRKS